ARLVTLDAGHHWFAGAVTVSSSRLLGPPRVVGAETPEMSFKITTCKASTAVIFVFDIQHDPGTGSFRSRIKRIGVRNDDIRALCLGSADFVRLPHQPAELRIQNRSEHDHSVAEVKLGMDNGVALAGHYKMLLKPEALAQPLDCGWRIAIPQAWNHRRFGILREAGHDISFLIC